MASVLQEKDTGQLLWDTRWHLPKYKKGHCSGHLMHRLLQVVLIGILCTAAPFAQAKGSRSGSRSYSSHSRSYSGSSRSSHSASSYSGSRSRSSSYPRSYTASRSYSSHSGTSSRSSSHSGSSRSTYCASCSRDSRGRIKRSPEAKHEFERSHPCPTTGKTSGSCAGYVVDDVTPLKRGGEDAPSNMQWQTKADAKAKDAVE